MIRIPDGYGLTDADDAAVTSLREGCDLHRLIGKPNDGTVCGLPEYDLVHPFPAVGYAALLATSLCKGCWPRRSVWSVLVRKAHPDPPRGVDVNSGRAFDHINSSRLAGHPLDERSSR